MDTTDVLSAAIDAVERWQPCTNAGARLANLIDNPSTETWEAAHCLVVSCFFGDVFTLWRAVSILDPQFPKTRDIWTSWPVIPSRDNLVRALFFACAPRLTPR